MSAGNCNRCGTFRRWLHGHHIVPRSEGGSDDPSNIEHICANCHEDEHGAPFGNLIRAQRRRKARETAVPKELLERLYNDEVLSIAQIALRLDTSKSNVQFWMVDYEIDRRGVGRRTRSRPSTATLRELYVDARLSLETIARSWGVSRETVRHWCLADGIKLRSKAEAALAKREDSA